MCEDEDAWINAIAEFTNGKNPEPLVALLRSDTPITAGARDLLAELFNPGEPSLFGGRLVWVDDSGDIAKNLRAAEQLAGRTFRIKKHALGRPGMEASTVPLLETGERTIYRRKARWRSLVRRLLKRD
jgi:hypothetical protein